MQAPRRFRRRWFQTASRVPAATTSPKTTPTKTKVATVAAAPAAPSSVRMGAAQQTAQAAAAAPTTWRSVREGSQVARFGPGGDLDEGDGAAVRLRALEEVVAAGLSRGDQAGPNHLEIGDLLIDLGEFGRGARP